LQRKPLAPTEGGVVYAAYQHAAQRSRYKACSSEDATTDR
jgi:hypothetical protein